MFLPWVIGICSDVAQSKHEHWSSLAPLPFEVVISAGQKAKEDSWNKSELTFQNLVGLVFSPKLAKVKSNLIASPRC